MLPEPPVTYVETELHRRRRHWLLAALAVLALVLLIGLVAVCVRPGRCCKGLTVNRTEAYPDIIAHFEHGSIGADEKRHAVLGLAGVPRLFPRRSAGASTIALSASSTHG